MKIAFSPYELSSSKTLGKSSGMIRKGALLRIRYEDLTYGYADCHPWPELGDEPLELQLRLLADAVPTQLVRRSLALARVDAEYRQAGQSAFSGSVPPSHVLSGHALDLTPSELEHWAHEGFRWVKAKAGKNPLEEARHLRAVSRTAAQNGIKLRIDLNESLSLQEALQFFDILCTDDGASGIDFVEDPVSFRVEDWRLLKQRFPLRLALDRGAGLPHALNHSEDPAFDLVVLKPAIQDPTPLFERIANTSVKLVVTSYLDHPVGTAGAAWHAMRAGEILGNRLESCGLMSHLNYNENVFSRRLGHENARWIPPSGTGWGFDEELASMDWRSLP